MARARLRRLWAQDVSWQPGTHLHGIRTALVDRKHGGRGVELERVQECLDLAAGGGAALQAG